MNNVYYFAWFQDHTVCATPYMSFEDLGYRNCPSYGSVYEIKCLQLEDTSSSGIPLLLDVSFWLGGTAVINHTLAQNVTILSGGKAKIKYMTVSGNVMKKMRVGRSEKYFILFFHFILKWCKMQKLMWSLFVL